MKLLRTILILFFMLNATACFEMRQEVWILKDGQGRMKMDFGVEKKIADLMAQSSGENNNQTNPFSTQGLKELEKKIKADPEIVAVKTKTFNEGEMQFISVDVTNKDFTKIFEASSQSDETFKSGAVFKKTSDTSYEMTYNFENAQGSKQKITEEEKQNLKAMFGDHKVTLVFHAPKILKTNGKKINDTTVNFEVPLAEINNMKKGIDWKVEFAVE